MCNESVDVFFQLVDEKKKCSKRFGDLFGVQDIENWDFHIFPKISIVPSQTWRAWSRSFVLFFNYEKKMYSVRGDSGTIFVYMTTKIEISTLGARSKPSTFVYRAGWLVEPSIFLYLPSFAVSLSLALSLSLSDSLAPSQRFMEACTTPLMSKKSTKNTYLLKWSCGLPKIVQDTP